MIHQFKKEKTMTAQKLFLGNICTMDEVKPFAKALTVVDGKIQYDDIDKLPFAKGHYCGW